MLALCICVLIYSGWRSNSLPQGIETFMGAYGLHAVGTMGYCFFMRAIMSSLHLCVVGFIAVVGSTLEELHQYYEPGRVVDMWDVVAQVIGVIVGLGVIKVIDKNYPGRTKVV